MNSRRPAKASAPVQSTSEDRKPPGGRLKRGPTLFQSADSILSGAITSLAAYLELRSLSQVPLVAPGISLQTLSLLDILYVTAVVCWLIYLANVGWLVSRASGLSRTPFLAWFPSTLIRTLMGIGVFVVALIGIDSALHVLDWAARTVDLITAVALAGLIAAAIQLPVSDMARSTAAAILLRHCPGASSAVPHATQLD